MLGDFLKKYRDKYNLSQEEMAKKLETAQSYYSQIESGTVKPGHFMVKKLAKVLDVEESFIKSLM